jgi:hypothetical protein
VETRKQADSCSAATVYRLSDRRVVAAGSCGIISMRARTTARLHVCAPSHIDLLQRNKHAKLQTEWGADEGLARSKEPTASGNVRYTAAPSWSKLAASAGGQQAGVPMATFVVLATFSDAGIKNVKRTIKRADAFKSIGSKGRSDRQRHILDTWIARCRCYLRSAGRRGSYGAVAQRQLARQRAL